MSKKFNLRKLQEVESFTKDFSETERKGGFNILMSVLAYINILFLIPLIFAKKSAYVMFHVKQGINLFIFSLAAGSLVELFNECFLYQNSFWAVGGHFLIALVIIFYYILVVSGVINAFKGEAETLPYIGKF